MGKMIRAKFNELDWFKIDNYDYINNLTVGEFLMELEERNYMYNDALPRIINYDKETSIAYNSIISGEPKLTELRKKMNMENQSSHEPLVVNNFIGMRLLTGNDIHRYYESIELRNSGSISGLNIKALNLEKLDSINMMEPLAEYDFPEKGLFCIFLDMQTFTDEELVHNFSDMLKFLRDKYIPNPKGSENKVITSNKINKLYEYSIIPLIDLYLWGKANGKIIPTTILDKKLNNLPVSFKSLVSSAQFEKKYLNLIKDTFDDGLDSRCGLLKNVIKTLFNTPNLWNKKIADLNSEENAISESYRHKKKQ